MKKIFTKAITTVLLAGILMTGGATTILNREVDAASYKMNVCSHTTITSRVNGGNVYYQMITKKGTYSHNHVAEVATTISRETSREEITTVKDNNKTIRAVYGARAGSKFQYSMQSVNYKKNVRGNWMKKLTSGGYGNVAYKCPDCQYKRSVSAITVRTPCCGAKYKINAVTGKISRA